MEPLTKYLALLQANGRYREWRSEQSSSNSSISERVPTFDQVVYSLLLKRTRSFDGGLAPVFDLANAAPATPGDISGTNSFAALQFFRNATPGNVRAVERDIVEGLEKTCCTNTSYYSPRKRRLKKDFCFRATRDISRGEELFSDYYQRAKDPLFFFAQYGFVLAAQDHALPDVVDKDEGGTKTLAEWCRGLERGGDVFTGQNSVQSNFARFARRYCDPDVYSLEGHQKLLAREGAGKYSCGRKGGA